MLDKCVDIAGHLLADAIALLVELFRCRNLRLAGGALSPPTGDLLKEKAAKVLSDVYGLQVISKDEDQPAESHDPHVLTRVRRLRLVLSAEAKGGHTGERGAALAARDALIREDRLQALAKARSEIAERKIGVPFRIWHVIRNLSRDGLPLTASDVKRLLDEYAATLAVRPDPSNALEAEPREFRYVRLDPLAEGDSEF
jgi:hypothetical protein